MPRTNLFGPTPFLIIPLGITLSRFFNDHMHFFSDQDGNLRLSPSWNVFRVREVVQSLDKIYCPSLGAVLLAFTIKLSLLMCQIQVAGSPSGTDASGEEYQVDHPLVELPPNATDSEKQRAFKLARAAGEELDSVSVPTHGGESPGSSSSISTATVFKYVLGSLLLVGLVVGIFLTFCSCSHAKQ